jgi:hypothetical protein
MVWAVTYSDKILRGGEADEEVTNYKCDDEV